jgi:hypothetical protein
VLSAEIINSTRPSSGAWLRFWGNEMPKRRRLFDGAGCARRVIDRAKQSIRKVRAQSLDCGLSLDRFIFASSSQNSSIKITEPKIYEFRPKKQAYFRSFFHIILMIPKLHKVTMVFIVGQFFSEFQFIRTWPGEKSSRDVEYDLLFYASFIIMILTSAN